MQNECLINILEQQLHNKGKREHCLGNEPGDFELNLLFDCYYGPTAHRVDLGRGPGILWFNNP